MGCRIRRMMGIVLFLAICVFAGAGPAETAGETVAVSFMAGAGTGRMDPVSLPRGVETPVPACGFTAPAEPDGTVFEGWEYNGTLYEPGDTIVLDVSSATLTARWLSPWGAAKKEIEKPGTTSYTLTRDLIAAPWDQPITAARGLYASKSVDLNGHTMDASAMNEDWSSFFRVESGMSFSILDSQGGGKMIGAESGSCYPVEVEGTLFLKGGSITGNRRGGVKCGSADASGTVRIQGGNITRNGTGTGTGNDGAGVYVVKGALYMESGEISENNLGVMSGTGTITMSGGSITGNRGFGIYGGGSTYITGGSVTGNMAGVKTAGEIAVAGMVTITGNGTDGNPGRDLELNANQTVSFRGPLDAEARIGVRPYGSQSFPYIFTADLRYNGKVCAVPENFFSTEYMIGKTKDTQGRDRLTLTYGVRVLYDPNGGSGGNHPDENRPEGIAWQLPECTFTAPEGRMFDAWEMGGTRYDAGAWVTVEANTAVKALWKDLPPISFAEMQERLNAGGAIVLTRNVLGAADEPCLEIPAGGTVTLDLNGHTIGRDGSSMTLLIPEQAELMIADSSPEETGAISAQDGTEDCIRNRGRLELQSGRISGNPHGGIDNYGTFRMSGGTVSGAGTCEAGTEPAGAAVTNRGGGVFTMTGGSLSDNAGCGVINGGTFALEGGTICRNTGGGVISVTGGQMTMSGGSVSDNGRADLDYAGIRIDGGTVAVSGGSIERNTSRYGTIAVGEDGSLTMTGGSVKNNRTCGIHYGGGTFAIGGNVGFGYNNNSTDSTYSCDVYMAAGKTIALTETLGRNTVVRIRLNAGPDDGAVIPITTGYLDGNGTARAEERNFYDVSGVFGRGLKNGEAAFIRPPESWTDLQQAADGADAEVPFTVRLKADVVCQSAEDMALTIAAGKNMILDLNGHTLDRNGMNSRWYETIKVEKGATLTIRDTSSGQTGKITGEHSPGGWQYPCIANQGTLILESGSITGNYTGGVYNNGVFRMTGGTVAENGHSSGSENGVRNDGQMTMSGGSISENRGCGLANSGSFTMSGGTIHGNEICGIGNHKFLSTPQILMSGGTISGNGGSNSSGSAINSTGGSVRMVGGTITGNYGVSAVYVSGEGHSFTITDNGAIRDNHAGGAEARNSGYLAIGGPYIRISGNTDETRGEAWDLSISTGNRIHIVDSMNGSFTAAVKLTGNPPTGGAVIPITEGYLNEYGSPRAWVNNFTDMSGVYRTIEADGELAFTDAEEPPELSDWERLQQEISSAGTGAVTTVTLAGNVYGDAGDEPITIPAGRRIILDLNSYYLSRNLVGSAHPQALIIDEGAELTIRDSSDRGTGTINGENDPTGMRPCILNRGTLRLESGTIADNRSGGVENAGIFHMSGGTIHDNGPSDMSGPAGPRFGVKNDGEMHMTGGVITGNYGYGVWNNGTFSLSGGSISFNKLSGVYNSRTEADGTFGEMDITGGSIWNNGTYQNGEIGAGIYNLGTVRMSGGMIHENYGPSAIEMHGAESAFTMTGGSVCSNHGGGISAQSGTISLGGNVNLYGNSDGGSTFYDVALGTGKRIHLVSPLSSAYSIRIRMNSWPSQSGPATMAFTEGLMDGDGNPRAGTDTFIATKGGLSIVTADGELAFSCWQSGTMDEPDFVLPEGIRTIEAGALAGTGAEVIALPEKDEEITVAAGAFAGCPNLRQIFLPANVRLNAGDELFDEGQQVTIFGRAGSDAEAYAAGHGNVSFVVVPE